jgi:hypothetical protein
MILVTEILSIPKQRFNEVWLENGEIFTLELEYQPQQIGWVFSLFYKDTLPITNFRLVWSTNILYNQKNILPFGLACYSKDGLDPAFLDDFTLNERGESRCQLYILNEEEVKEFSNI